MTRPSVRERPDPRSRDITPEQIVAATRSGIWTLSDWRIALGEDQIAEVTEDVLDKAVRARSEREAGRPPSLSYGIGVAAEIVSYLPGEHVPEHLSAILDRSLHREHSPASIVYLITAVLAVIILDTRDGMAMRHRLWACDAAATD